MEQTPSISATIEKYLLNLDDHTVLERVLLEKMKTAAYCRPVGPAQLGRMLKSGFDPRALGFPVLSLQADGYYHIVDGNHRRHLAASQGIESMICRVFIDLTYEEEALLYEKLNTTKPSTALDRWRSRIERKEPSSLEIAEILRHHGLHISTTGKSNDPCGINCVRALDAVHIQRGSEELDEVLGILKASWPKDRVTFTADILQGMSAFWARYRTQVDSDRLITQLKKTNPQRLRAQAGLVRDSFEPSVAALGRQIRKIYIGSSIRYALPEWIERVTNQATANTVYPGKKILKKKGAPRMTTLPITPGGHLGVPLLFGEELDEANRLAQEIRNREFPSL